MHTSKEAGVLPAKIDEIDMIGVLGAEGRCPTVHHELFVLHLPDWP